MYYETMAFTSILNYYASKSLVNPALRKDFSYVKPNVSGGKDRKVEA